MNINILILSAGRRVELIQSFIHAREKLQLSGSVIAADASELAAACFIADKAYKICRIDNDNYIKEIVNICRSESIDLVIPTIDTELMKLSQNIQMIENETNSKVLISSSETILICRDKYKTTEFLDQQGFRVPKHYNVSELRDLNLSFPLFIKPKDGSSSINAFKINNEKELFFFVDYIKSPILQEYVKGTEYTIDVFCDFNGNPITIVPRKRLEVRGGEVLKGTVEKNRLIIDELKKLVSILKPVGQITVQGILNEEGFYFIEINPRFGGGAPMSFEAGADSAINLYKLLLGEKLDYNEDYEDGLTGLRFDQAIYVDQSGRLCYEKGLYFRS